MLRLRRPFVVVDEAHHSRTELAFDTLARFAHWPTHASKLAFVAGWLSDLLVQPGFDLARANLQKFLLRNLARRGGASIFLQKANGRFFPDFICKRHDGSFLIVEYQGGDRWKEAEDDRLIGGLWARLSGAPASSSC